MKKVSNHFLFIVKKISQCICKVQGFHLLFSSFFTWRVDQTFKIEIDVAFIIWKSELFVLNLIKKLGIFGSSKFLITRCLIFVDSQLDHQLAVALATNVTFPPSPLVLINNVTDALNRVSNPFWSIKKLVCWQHCF